MYTSTGLETSSFLNDQTHYRVWSLYYPNGVTDIYLTKKIRRGWIVVNKRTGNHAHFKSEYGCHCILIFIREKIVPDNPYLKESYERLTTDRKQYKDRYFNEPVKGVRL